MSKRYLAIKTILFLLCIGSLIYSWYWSKYHNEKEFKEEMPLNWNQNMITSIQIIKNDEDCLEQYQPVLFTQLFDLKSSNIYYQRYKDDPIFLFSDQVAQIQQSTVNKELNYFAFINQAQNQQTYWKMCTKSMTDISFSSKKNQLLELCEIHEKICPAENNKFMCVLNQFSCPPNSNNFCPFDKKQCIVNSKIQCVDYDESCPKQDQKKQCHPSQKLCIIQDRVLCQDANDQCPIVDILILEKSQHTPENYEEEVINFDSNYKLLVKRNDPSKWPVAEIAIFREGNQCLTDSQKIQNLFTIKNDRFQLNTCMDGIDNRYQEIFQQSLSTKQLFLSNNIIKDNEDVNIELNQQFKIYQRQYYFFNTTCSYSNYFQSFKTKQLGIGDSDLFIKFIIVMLLLINIIMSKLFNKVSEIYMKAQIQFLTESSLLNSLVVAIINAILLYFLDFKQIKFQYDLTQQLIKDECVDQYTKVNILNIQRSLNMLKFFWKILFIFLIIEIFFLILSVPFEMQISFKNRNENKLVKMPPVIFLISCFLCEGFLLICNTCCFYIEKCQKNNYQVGQNQTRCSCSSCGDYLDETIKNFCQEYCESNCSSSKCDSGDDCCKCDCGFCDCDKCDCGQCDCGGCDCGGCDCGGCDIGGCNIF